jgi:membrane-bound serine protease (ClpP class)
VRRFITLTIALAAASCLLTGFATAQATAPEVLVLDASGPLTPAMAEYLDRGLARAESDQAELVVLQLDTPGGAIDLMNRMVQAIRASTVPVVVYVSPRGAIAGSAGTVLTLAGHAAAMAPETAIGAASPVGSQGEDLQTTLATKEKEILKATARSLAANRSPQAIAMAEAAIDDAKAASADEAYSAGLVDFIADNVNDLLAQMNGYTVLTPAGPVMLRTSQARIIEVPQSLIEQVLQALTNPNIVFLLLALGIQAVLIEISSPGGWVAGFIGVVSLALGAYGLGILPVNWFGLIFLVTAFVLFILDVKAPTHGALTAAGLVSFIIGALVLFNSPGTPEVDRVSVPLVVAVGLISGALFSVVVSFAVRAQLRPVSVGREALIGRIGEARTDLSPNGMVQVAGELWSAGLEGDTGSLASGTRVEVVGVEGIRLLVREKKRS